MKERNIVDEILKANGYDRLEQGLYSKELNGDTPIMLIYDEEKCKITYGGFYLLNADNEMELELDKIEQELEKHQQEVLLIDENDCSKFRVISPDKEKQKRIVNMLKNNIRNGKEKNIYIMNSVEFIIKKDKDENAFATMDNLNFFVNFNKEEIVIYNNELNSNNSEYTMEYIISLKDDENILYILENIYKKLKKELGTKTKLEISGITEHIKEIENNEYVVSDHEIDTRDITFKYHIEQTKDFKMNVVLSRFPQSELSPTASHYILLEDWTMNKKDLSKTLIKIKDELDAEEMLNIF